MDFKDWSVSICGGLMSPEGERSYTVGQSSAGNKQYQTPSRTFPSATLLKTSVLKLVTAVKTLLYACLEVES